MKTLLVALCFALAACPGSGSPSRPPDPTETPPTTADPGAVQDRDQLPPTPPPEQPAEQGSAGSGSAVIGQADGSPCLASIECSSGVCEGEGCTASQPGKCVPRARACTRDLRPYCGCDGKTFRTSGSCPGQRYSAKGACP